MRNLIIGGVLIIIAIVLITQSLYVVDETEQVIITRFGDVQDVHRTSGIRAKAPFVDSVVRFDRRLLRIDADPESMRDKKKENLEIDSYARYRIIDPVQFRKTLITEDNAFSRLGDIVNSTLREEIALLERPQIIGARAVVDPFGDALEDEEGLPLIEGTESRTALLGEVLEGVRLRVVAEERNQEVLIPSGMQGEATITLVVPELILDKNNADRDSNLNTGVSAEDVGILEAPDGGETEGLDVTVKLWEPAIKTITFGVQPGEILNEGDSFTAQYFIQRNEPLGIEVVDVRIKRADFPDTVTPSIFTRMRAERNRIATRFRAVGDQRDLEIRAGANKEREVILADADKESNELRGEGEAEAIRILAEALEKDPEFFAFRRSLEAYRQFLNTGTTVILSADSDIFQFLDSPGGPGQEASVAEPR
jgi:regulator of protease activity HflC (stomatin/prohibitin superfamily)